MVIERELFIAGQDVPALNRRTTQDICPYTGEVYAVVAGGEPADVVRAVDAADRAFADWAATPPSVRRGIFLKAADILEARATEVATLMAGEVGGVRPWAEFNTQLGASILREAAAAVTQPLGEVLATEPADRLSLAVREPVGVVAAFSPWNAPVILGTRAIAIPLAVGNTVVLKPSEDAPIVCGLLLADVLWSLPTLTCSIGHRLGNDS